MSLSVAEKTQSFQSHTDYQDLAGVFGASNAKTQAWKRKPKQCVMRLHDPSQHEESTEATATWFMQKWHRLLERDQLRFRTYMSGRSVLDLGSVDDFCVSTREGSTFPVIFYVDSRLRTLADEFFKNVRVKTALQQALDVVHNPDVEYGAFWKIACDVSEEYLQDGAGRTHHADAGTTHHADLTLLLAQLKAV